MTQIRSVTSEALQAQIRRLLPSQQGFGEDLQATNLITPIIDLTPAAEGSQLPLNLANAHSFGNTDFNVTGTTTTINSNSGFFRVWCTAVVEVSNTGGKSAIIQLNDQSTSKNIYNFSTSPGLAGEIVQEQLDFIVFQRPQDDLIVNTDADCRIAGSFRQIADLYGNLVNPLGFSFE